MLPPYVLRVMGAGDVKLMAMVGAFLGYSATLHALLYVLVVGAIAAIGFALAKKSLGQMLLNSREAAQTVAAATLFRIRPAAPLATGKSVGKLPYGVCIAIGTMGSVIARHFGIA